MNHIQALIVKALHAARTDLDRAHMARENAIILARNLGLTHAQIGAQLGLTESGVRHIINRATKER